MKYLSFGVVLFACAGAIGAQTPAGKTDDKIAKEAITLTGCVETGTKPDTFVLTHVVRSDRPKDTAGVPQPSIANPTATPPIASPTGTSGADSSTAAAIYSLDSPEKVKSHVGHKVSVVGTVDDEADATKSKEGNEKPTVEGDKAPSYKVKVNSVTMLSSSCS